MECPECSSEIRDDSRFCRVCGRQFQNGDRIRPANTQAVSRSRGDLMIGSSFLGRYEIVEELGRGGMGVVYKAEDTKLRRHVALKFLPPGLTRDPCAKDRFVHEAQAASALDHPNICIVHEIDETDDGQMFISMGCYEGETLKEKIARGPLDVDEAIDIAAQVVDGLEDAHAKGIVHRDIKPSNIMITAKGQVKIMDFGLAKLAGQTRITKAGTTMGTIAYMSPEQARGEDIDQRTDIWSLGVVLYELLTGEQPFKGEYDQAVIYSILNEDHRPVTEINREIPAEIGAIVDRCLKKGSGDRYQSAGELAVDLKKLTKGYSSRGYARLPSAVPSLGSLTRSGLFRVGIPVALVVVGVLLLTVLPAGRNALEGLLVGGDRSPEFLKVALLPCDMEGLSAEDRAFCDGLMRQVTVKMRGIAPLRDRLWIIPGSEVSMLETASPTEARRDLGVDIVITGRMRRVGDAFEIGFVRNDMDIEADNEMDDQIVRQRRSPLLVDPVANLSTWQDSIITVLAGLLDVTLTPEAYGDAGVNETAVPGAYESFLRGIGYLSPYRGREDLDLAVGSFESAVADDHSYAPAHAWLGKGYLLKYIESGDEDWAERGLASCERALEIDDGLLFARWVIGEIHRHAGRFEEAVEYFGQVTEIDGGHLWAHMAAGKAYTSLGKLDLAADSYRQATESEPLYPKAYHYLGFTYYQDGRYEEAIYPFLKLIELRPGVTAGYTNLGAVYFQLDRWSEAREVWEQCLTIDSTCFVCSNLGTIYFAEARYVDAARLYRKALEFSPDDYLICGHLAECYFWIPREKKRSAEYFERAIGLAEMEQVETADDAGLLSSLASYYERVDRKTDALRLVEDAANLEPADPVVLFRIAETYEQLGNRETAIVWIRKALDKGAPVVKVERYPGLKELRADPRYKTILRELGGA